jgi:hypothetical protein
MYTRKIPPPPNSKAQNAIKKSPKQANSTSFRKQPMNRPLVISAGPFAVTGMEKNIDRFCVPVVFFVPKALV